MGETETCSDMCGTCVARKGDHMSKDLRKCVVDAFVKTSSPLGGVFLCHESANAGGTKPCAAYLRYLNAHQRSKILRDIEDA
jgi:hypothetical protein